MLEEQIETNWLCGGQHTLQSICRRGSAAAHCPTRQCLPLLHAPPSQPLNRLAACLQVTEYLHAGARQFGFMVRALQLLEPKLQALNIPFFLLKGA